MFYYCHYLLLSYRYSLFLISYCFEAFHPSLELLFHFPIIFNPFLWSPVFLCASDCSYNRTFAIRTLNKVQINENLVKNEENKGKRKCSLFDLDGGFYTQKIDPRGDICLERDFRIETSQMIRLDCDVLDSLFLLSNS